DTLLGRWSDRGDLVLDEVHISPEELRRINKIVVVACGSAYYAGMVAKYAIEHWTRVACEVDLASEFRYRDPIIDPMTLVVTVSQSGETADTLMAIRHAREQHAKVIAICNTNGATIPRESDAVIYTHAGPEIGVASTKGFLTQVVACYLLGLYLAQVRGMKYGDEIRGVMSELDQMPGKIQEVLDEIEPVYE
ncbi:SIS domain-containing protein, partial [Cutibacterium acnes subsp. acnes]|nr:SIS domain-containing protein [Cutibacterium acnes subsp. acnes]